MTRAGRWVVVAWLAPLACGGSTATGPPADGAVERDGGSQDAGDARPVPLARAQAIVTMSGGAAAGCVTVPPMRLGDFPDVAGGTKARPVVSGDVEGGNAVSVACRVVAAGSGFSLEATIAIAGDATLTLRATTDAQARTTAGRMTLRKTAAWSSTSCTFDAAALSPSGGVANGRYWALVTCGGATSDIGATCDIFGQIRVENCTAK